MGITNFDTLELKGTGSTGVTPSTAKTSALLQGGGSSSAPVAVSVADKNFIDYRAKSTAVSGDSRNMYLRHELAGVIASAGYGDCARLFTVVTGTGYSSATGNHSTLQINDGATVTGLGAAVRATLQVDADETQGSIYAMQVETIASLAVTATEYSYMRFTSSVSDTGTKPAYLMILDSVDTSDLFVGNTDTPDKGLKIKVNGVDYWIMLSAATS